MPRRIRPSERKFQSTHPSGVRPKPSCRRVDCPQFQSTHPSGVRLPHHVRRGARFRISIHAPQWGATSPEGATALVHTISIHAPQWGATPRRPIGGLPREISIHAPQWGATNEAQEPQGNEPISIHAPQWGATDSFVFSDDEQVFQSTHPSGVRHLLVRAVASAK